MKVPLITQTLPYKIVLPLYNNAILLFRTGIPDRLRPPCGGEIMSALAKYKAKFLRGIVFGLIFNLAPIFWISSINPSFADGVQAPINLSVTISDWGTIPLTGGANQKSSFYVLVPLVPGIEDYRLFAYSSGNTVEVLTSLLTLVQPAFPVNLYDTNGNYVENVMSKRFIFDSLPAGVEYTFGIQSIDPAGISDSSIIVPTIAGSPLAGTMTRIRPKLESLEQNFANPSDYVTVFGSNLDWINRNQNGYEDGIELSTCIEYCEPDPIDDPVFLSIGIPLANFISQSANSITFQFPSVLPNGVSPGAVWEVIPQAWGASGSLSLTVGSANGQISRTISTSFGSNGSITPGTSSAISDGSTAVYTITPDAGYEIASAAVDGISVLDLLSDVDGVSKSYTFDSVTSNHTIAASFRLPPENPPTNLQEEAHGEYEFVGDGTSQHSFFRLRWTKASGVSDYKIRVTPTGQAAQIYLFSDLQRISNPVYVPNNSCSGNFCYATISGLNTGPDYQIEVASVGGVGKSDSTYLSTLYNQTDMPSIFQTNFKPVNNSLSQVLTEPGDLITIRGAHLDLAQRIIFDAYTDETLHNGACWVDENDEEFCGGFSIEASDFASVSPTSISFYVPSTFPPQLPASTFWEGYATRIDGYGFFGRVQFALSTSVSDNSPTSNHGLVPDIVNLSTEDAVTALGANFTLGSTSGTTSVNATPQNDGKIATQSLVGDQSYGSVISYTTYAYSPPIIDTNTVTTPPIVIFAMIDGDATLAGGQTLLVEGYDFQAGATVSVAGSACIVTGRSSTYSVPNQRTSFLIECTMPAITAFGSLNLVVTNDDGGQDTWTVIATPANHAVIVVSGANGTISPGTLVSIAPGSARTYTFTPSTGYKLNTATLDGNNILGSLAVVSGEIRSYTFSSVTADHVIEATFISVLGAQTSVVVAALSALKFEDDGTGTGGKLIWTGKNIDAVLFTGLATAYPGPYNYGAFTSGWNGRLRNLDVDTSYTVSILAISADGVGESKTLTFKTSPGASSTSLSNISVSNLPELSQLEKLFEWIDQNLFTDGEASRVKRMLSKFDALPALSKKAYMKLPTSRVTKISAVSETPAFCKVEKGLSVHALKKGKCVITYTVTSRSKAPASLTKEFNFPKV